METRTGSIRDRHSRTNSYGSLRRASIGWSLADIGLALIAYALRSIRRGQATRSRLTVQLDENSAHVKGSVALNAKVILIDYLQPA